MPTPADEQNKRLQEELTASDLEGQVPPGFGPQDPGTGGNGPQSPEQGTPPPSPGAENINVQVNETGPQVLTEGMGMEELMATLIQKLDDLPDAIVAALKEC